ncbi:MAG: ABC transporter permease [Anaerolineales bacterium]|nr:ABC transporter permease [Anaerolineales bacterium]
MINHIAQGARYAIQKREVVTRKDRLIATLIAILAAFIVSGILMKMAGASVWEAFAALFGGAFGGQRSLLETLVKTTPLLLTAEAVALTFQGKIWNIGAEGQLFSGAMAAYWTYTLFQHLPPAPLFVLVVLGGFLGGAICGALAGILKARFNVDVIISTVLINYVVNYFLSFMLSATGPWRSPESYYPHTPEIDNAARWLILIPKSRLHLGFLIAVGVVAGMYFLLKKTVFGMKIRSMGFNPTASTFRGIDTKRVMIITMLISGGIAGLAGVSEVFGVQYRLRPDISPGYGFTGIIVAILGGLHPLGVAIAAFFFGGLLNGSVRMQILTRVPVALVDVIQAIILLFLLTAQVIARYRLVRVKPC